jgi:hypothetical protein
MFRIYVGLGLAFLFLGIGLGTIRLLSDACAIITVVCFVGAGVTGFKRKGNKYDLGELRDLQEREELSAINLEVGDAFDSVHCMNCGEIYNMRLPLCPFCKSPQGHAPGM